MRRGSPRWVCGSVVADPRKMNNLGVTKNDDGFSGISNGYLFCPTLFLLGLVVF